VLELVITPIEGGEPSFDIVDLDDVTPAQKLLRQAWLHL
jgi:hypothetical protein